ncbi:MAG: hypothetical protein NT090_15235 [Acidobacteria bacterium]|nr:hypothetical protein [Acidobacteriota bacterium]
MWAQVPFSSPFIEEGPVNAASYAPQGWPNSGIAQGSRFVLTAYILGPAQPQEASGFPLRTDLGGISIKVTVGGESVNALIISASFWQVIGLLPSTTPLGEGTLTLTYQGQSTRPVPIRVVKSSFGIATRNGAGTGPGVLRNLSSGDVRVPNTLLEPARPNQRVQLEGTGLGPVNGDEAAGPIPGEIDADVQVMVGDRQATVVSKGRSDCCAGIDYIDFEVPPGVEGCYVPVAVRAGGVLSNFATMSIAPDGKACADLLGLSTTEAEKLRNGERLSLGQVELMRLGLKIAFRGVSAEFVMDVGFGSFASFSAADLYRSGQVISFWRTGAPSPGTCLVLPANSNEDFPLPAYKDFAAYHSPTSLKFLDAGENLNLTGPSGSRELYRSYSQYWGFLGGLNPEEGVSPPYLEPGAYTLGNGSGGEDIGAFEATLKVPSPMVWTNEQSVQTIPRDQDLTITWSSPDADRELVTIAGISIDGDVTPTAFLCTERANAGRFTVPSWVLSAMMKSQFDSDLGIPLGVLFVMSSLLDSESSFRAPNLDAGRLQYLQGQMRYIEYR